MRQARQFQAATVSNKANNYQKQPETATATANDMTPT
jgi:hypothetical protein